MSYIPRLQTQYAEEIAPALMKQFEYKSAMQVPRIEKICLNQGLGKAVADRKMVDTAVEEMSTIAGQKAVPTLSTKDVSNFKLRKGMPNWRPCDVAPRTHVRIPRSLDRGVPATDA